MGTTHAYSQRSTLGSQSCHLAVLEGAERRHVSIGKLPFTIGRRPENFSENYADPLSIYLFSDSLPGAGTVPCDLVADSLPGVVRSPPGGPR